MIFDKIATIIADELGVEEEEIEMETNLTEDLGADSLDAVELIMAIEDEFNIEIADEDAQKVMTVKDLVDYVENHS